MRASKANTEEILVLAPHLQRRQIPVVEIDLTESGTDKHIHLHLIWRPGYHDPGRYRHLMSFDSFFSGAKRHNWRRGYKLYFGQYSSMEEFDQMCKLWSVPGYPESDDRLLPRTEYPDLWSFYLAIGYDYKHKRYINH